MRLNWKCHTHVHGIFELTRKTGSKCQNTLALTQYSYMDERIMCFLTDWKINLTLPSWWLRGNENVKRRVHCAHCESSPFWRSGFSESGSFQDCHWFALYDSRVYHKERKLLSLWLGLRSWFHRFLVALTLNKLIDLFDL